MKKVLYINMDNVLVGFASTFSTLSPQTLKEYDGRLDDVPGIFSKMMPMADAVDAFATLARVFDAYILSTAPWLNTTGWSDKVHWVQQHLGDAAYKRLILTHHKNLNRGDFLVDDRTKNGADRFEGELTLFAV
jgi:5'(3')-deoxyribonucleotidase